MGSWVRSGVLAAALVCGAFATATASAQEQPKGDAQRGKVVGNTCLGCHGIPGYKNAYPNYSVPKLEGQHPEYLVIALQGYKSGDRAHSTMHLQSITLSDQDMADVAAFFSSKPLQPAGKPAADVPKSAELCVTCHGTDGVGIAPLYPTLSGQHADYLARALLDYKRGARKNPVMAGFASQLTDAQILELADYYSRKKPGLETVRKPSTRLSAGR